MSMAIWGQRPRLPGGYGSSFDPTEPFHSKKYPYPALPNEPRMQAIEESVRKLGIHTFPMPLGLKRNDADPLASKCIRCDTCDAYPCLVHAKSDADINCIREILNLPNVTLMTNSRVTRLLTNSTGTAVTEVEVIHSGMGYTKPADGDLFRGLFRALRGGGEFRRGAACVRERQVPDRIWRTAPIRWDGTSCTIKRTRCWR